MSAKGGSSAFLKGLRVVAAVDCRLVYRHDQREGRLARADAPVAGAASTGPAPTAYGAEAAVPLVPDDLARLLPPGT